MTKPLLSLLTVVLFFLSSCQKTELAVPGTATSGATTADKTAAIASLHTGTVSDAHWYGKYYNEIDLQGNQLPGGDPDMIELYDYQFISGGVATLPWESGMSSFFSSIYFSIPSQYNLPGDSIIYEVVVKNGSGSGGIAGYDVLLTLVGEKNTAQVHFVSDKAYQSSTAYTLGTLSHTNLPALVQSFSNFQTVKLVNKKGKTAVYLNNKLLSSFKYTAANNLGRINEIHVDGKGSAVVDNVKLTNSVTSKKLLLEDFNTEGQSHTIFY